MNSNPNDSVVFARDTIDKQSHTTHHKINETVVSLMEPTIPVPWDSADKGATYDCGNYICVLLNPTFHVRMKNPRITWGFA